MPKKNKKENTDQKKLESLEKEINDYKIIIAKYR